MEIPRFKLGQEYNQYFYKFVPAMEVCEDGDFVKYHELERVKEELEKCYAEIADKEAIIAEYFSIIQHQSDVAKTFPKVLWYPHYSDGEVVIGSVGYNTKEECEASFTNSHWYASQIAII